MVANFATGGAAINVLARRAGARLVVVDAGVATPIEDDRVRSLRVGAGTANLAEGPAMTDEQVQRALEGGVALVEELGEVDVVGVGEMGIGNTTSASALTAAILGLDPASVCGRGTGLDDAGVARKVATVRRALEVNAGRDPLTALGGFEIALLVGVMRACAAKRTAVLLDGFITGAAALAAGVPEVLIASHRSPEPGHTLVLEALGLEPLLNLGLRLGEGSGAALALPLLQASIAILDEMATFAGAGVTDAGR
jgi:nicotinate-nucleotide--dimethylbenzimidazole phosphoribosyltransferase